MLCVTRGNVQITLAALVPYDPDLVVFSPLQGGHLWRPPLSCPTTIQAWDWDTPKFNRAPGIAEEKKKHMTTSEIQRAKENN